MIRMILIDVVMFIIMILHIITKNRTEIMLVMTIIATVSMITMKMTTVITAGVTIP